MIRTEMVKFDWDVVLSENLDENSFCAVVETKEILEQVEVKKKKSEDKYT